MLAEIDTESLFSAKAETLASREKSVETSTDTIKVEGDDRCCVDRILLFIISSPFYRLVFGFISSRRGKAVGCYVQLCSAATQQINHFQATVV